MAVVALVVHLPRLPGEALRRESDVLGAEAHLTEDDKEYYEKSSMHLSVLSNFGLILLFCYKLKFIVIQIC